MIFRLQYSPNAYPSVSLGRVEEDASVALLEDADKGRAEYCRLVQTIAEILVALAHMVAKKAPSRPSNNPLTTCGQPIIAPS